MDASFLATAMLKRLETLRRDVQKIGKPYVAPVAKKKAEKRPAAAADDEPEEGEAHTAAAAAAASSSGSGRGRVKFSKKKATAAAASSTPVKMKWDTPSTGDQEDPAYDSLYDQDPDVRRQPGKNPPSWLRRQDEDKRLQLTGSYREPKQMKVADWHSAIQNLFGFPVTQIAQRAVAYRCTLFVYNVANCTSCDCFYLCVCVG